MHIIYLSILFILIGCTPNKAIDKKNFEEIIQQSTFRVDVSAPNLDKKHETSTLLVSCVDFRLRDETDKLMEKHLFLMDDYDEIALPGASLALVQTKYPHWNKTLKDLIGLIEKLHHIKRVIFLDHRGCGAYNLLQGKEHAATPEKETHSHKAVLDRAREILKKDFPKLKVYTLLMGLDGVVENIQ
jgi:hypothetical protein